VIGNRIAVEIEGKVASVERQRDRVRDVAEGLRRSGVVTGVLAYAPRSTIWATTARAAVASARTAACTAGLRPAVAGVGPAPVQEHRRAQAQRGPQNPQRHLVRLRRTPEVHGASMLLAFHAACQARLFHASNRSAGGTPPSFLHVPLVVGADGGR